MNYITAAVIVLTAMASQCGRNNRLTLHTNGNVKVGVHLVLAFCFVSSVHLDRTMWIS